MANTIMVIAPYRYEGTWVFDDPAVGLIREPFVAGMPGMIDDLVRDIDNAWEGVRLTFSATPFPGYQQVLLHVREELGGHWYRTEKPPMEGWLCPVLLKYFDVAPARIYVRADPKG